MSSTGGEFDSELHRTALAQLDRVARRLELDPDVHERLRHPRRALVVTIPVRMDDGRTTAVHQADLGGIREGSYVRVQNGRAWVY